MRYVSSSQRTWLAGFVLLAGCNAITGLSKDYQEGSTGGGASTRSSGSTSSVVSSGPGSSTSASTSGGGSAVSSTTSGGIGGGGGSPSASVTSSATSSSSSGGPPPATGGPGTALVSAGQISTSPLHTLVGTLSQGPALNTPMASSKYSAVTGIVGTTQ